MSYMYVIHKSFVVIIQVGLISEFTVCFHGTGVTSTDNIHVLNRLTLLDSTDM